VIHQVFEAIIVTEPVCNRAKQQAVLAEPPQILRRKRDQQQLPDHGNVIRVSVV